MKLTENELRVIVRESLEEGFGDIARSVGRHASKIFTRPAGIIAKAIGRLATSKDSAGYEGRIDANVEDLEELVGDILYLPGKGLEMGYNAFEKLMYKIMPDLRPEEVKKLHKEIDEEKRKRSMAKNAKPAKRMSGPIPDQQVALATESFIKIKLKRIIKENIGESQAADPRKRVESKNRLRKTLIRVAKKF